MKDLSLKLDSLPWDNARITTMAEFLERYTLHDSCWVRFLADPDGTAEVLLKWDTHWTDGQLPYSTETKNWPLLIIMFEKLYQACFNGEDMVWNTVGTAFSNVITDQQKESWLALLPDETGLPHLRFVLEDSLHHTVIEDVGGGRVDLFHSAQVRILCLDEVENAIDIPWEGVAKN